MPQKPRALKRGDRIGIVAPASAPFDPTRYESGFEGIRKLGFEPHIVCVSDSIVQDLLLVKMDMGAAILPVSSRTLLTDGNLYYKKLVAPEMSTHTVVAWLKNRTLSSSSEHLIKLFREMFLSEPQASAEKPV